MAFIKLHVTFSPFALVNVPSAVLFLSNLSVHSSFRYSVFIMLSIVSGSSSISGASVPLVFSFIHLVMASAVFWPVKSAPNTSA